MKLDLGCGSYCRGDIGVDLDFSEKNIKYPYIRDVEKYIGGRHPSPKLIKGNLNESLQFDDKVFDEVVACHVLEHLESPLATLREVHRVLKPNGKFICLVPNPRDFSFDMGDKHHLYSWTPGSMTNLLRSVFREVQVGMITGKGGGLLGSNEHIMGVAYK